VCRHLAYAGPPVRLGSLLTDPPHALVRQAWAPRRQTHGVMNVDGFGVGWYVPGDPLPARHRGVGPVWADETFAELSRVISSGAFLAALRSATEGMAHGPAASAPFRHGRWLFSHNGAIRDWDSAVVKLAADLDPARLARLEVSTDSALLWVMVTQALDSGADPAQALAGTVRRARDAGGERLNLLLTDGTTIWATAVGASLVTRRHVSGGAVRTQPLDAFADGDGVVVASEPHDDEPGWADVPDGSLVVATAGDVRITPL
jgi:gamma-glutamyl hercynylcysteine S-oxide hydrolase